MDIDHDQPQLVVIADDLTGAADAGGAFASAGIATSIAFPDAETPRSNVVACFTDSRMLDSEAAGEVTTRTLAHNIQLGHREPRWLFKKIDSTLRGNPAAELFAVMDALNERTALVAPALPVEGRTTRDGHQYVHAIRLDQGSPPAARRDPDVAALFRVRDDTPVHVLKLEIVRAGDTAIGQYLTEVGPGIVVADAETDDDLLTLARAAAETPVRVLCGSAGFARALAVVLPIDRDRSLLSTHGDIAVPILVIAGSRQVATAGQVEHMELAGLRVIRPNQRMMESDVVSLGPLVADISRGLQRGESIVLTTAHLPSMPDNASLIADRLAAIVTAPEVCAHVGGLVLTGGDIAATVLRHLGVRGIHLRGEVRPAMPWGIAESALPSNLPVATKAGGFGDKDALLACVHHFHTDASDR